MSRCVQLVNNFFFLLRFGGFLNCFQEIGDLMHFPWTCVPLNQSCSYSGSTEAEERLGGSGFRPCLLLHPDPLLPLTPGPAVELSPSLKPSLLMKPWALSLKSNVSSDPSSFCLPLTSALHLHISSALSWDSQFPGKYSVAAK